ncbi:AAA family ATPase [Nocardia sp. NPDC049220]|uniref:helix-turn-helix transcriptional regulator n=1 Tax=Nocardia sp. NPDC049220 TaxID=3155273 RepID=UPI0034050DBF
MTTLAGRGTEVTSIERVLADARSGAACALVVLGEPGIGKTRLLSELSGRSTAAGFDVSTGRGSELEREVPFGMVVEALDKPFAALDNQVLADLGQQRLAELAAVLPSLAGRGENQASSLGIERFKFYRAVRATFERLVAFRPQVLALDDVHWADPASVELVSYLLRRLVPGMVFALAYRPRQMPTLILDAIVHVAQEGTLCALDLAPLTITETAEALGERAESSIVESLYAESAGNPFFLEHLARTARCGRSPSTCRPPHGKQYQNDIPTPLRTVILDELTGLDADTLTVLRAGAVVGDPFDVDLVAAIAEFDEQAVLKYFDELVASDLIRSTTTPGQFCFRHPIVRRVIYDEVTPSWRMLAHKQAAHALARRGADLSARAHHVEQSAVTGDDEAITLLEEAGLAAAPRAPVAAAGWFEAALHLLPKTGEQQPRRLKLLVSHANALADAGRLHDSRHVLEEVLESVSNESRGAWVQIVHMIARTDHGLGRSEEARQLIVRALDVVQPGSVDAVTLELALAENSLVRRQWEQSICLAALAEKQAGALGETAVLNLARSLLVSALAHQGDAAKARVIANDLAHDMDSSDDLLVPELLWPLANLADSELHLDRFSAAARHAERGLKISRATGHGWLVSRFLVAEAAAKLMLGRLHEASHAAESAVEVAQLFDSDQMRAAADGIHCWIEIANGNLPAALAAGRAAVEAVDRSPGVRYAWLARAGYAEALIETGEYERGREAILATGGLELRDMPPAARPYFLQALVTVELAAGRIDAASAVTRRLEEDSAQGLSCAGQAHYARTRVIAVSGDFRAAAEAANRASECFDAAEMHVWAARARLEAGRALARTGDIGSAIGEFEVAHSIFRDAGAVRLASQAAQELRAFGKRVRRRLDINEPDNPGTLTERERTVADRVAQGYTNREIAAELFLSPKTVEKHLARVFAKLGVASRAGVATAINRRTEY